MAGVAFTPTGIILGANVAIGTNANVTLDASRATDAIALPSGTTAQRPIGSPGEIRFNKQTQVFEGFVTVWTPFGGALSVQNNNVVVNTTRTLNFVNTSTILVTANDDFSNGRVTLSFTAPDFDAGSINVQANGNTTTALNAISNLNYNNTTTINVTVSGFQGNTTANVAFNANVAAIAGPAYNQANLAYGQANAAYNAANAAESTANNAGPWANVMAYGAVGDGVTDDTTAINNALAANEVVYLPPLKFRTSGSITVPSGKMLLGSGLISATAGGNTIGSVIYCDLSVSPAVNVGTFTGKGGGVKDFAIFRAPGTPANNSYGLRINGGQSIIAEDMYINSHGVPLYISGNNAGAAQGLGFMGARIFTGAAYDSHLVIDTWPEARFTQCRFGTNGIDDVNCNSYVTITGGIGSAPAGGPNTLVWENCQFNQGGGVRPSYLVQFINLNSPGVPTIDAREFYFVGCHVEGINVASFFVDTTWASIDRLVISACGFNTPGQSFFNLPSGTSLNDWRIVGNWIAANDFNIGCNTVNELTIGDNTFLGANINYIANGSWTISSVGNILAVGSVMNLSGSGWHQGLFADVYHTGSTFTSTATPNSAITVLNSTQTYLSNTIIKGTMEFDGPYPSTATVPANGAIILGSQANTNWYIGFVANAAADNNHIWEQSVLSAGNNMIFRVVNDAYSTSNAWLNVLRANDIITSMTYGQPGDLTSHNLLANGVTFTMQGGTAWKFRTGGGGLTYSTSGTPSNSNVTILLESNTELSMGFARTNTAPGNNSPLGKFTWAGMDANNDEQFYIQIEGFLASNISNSGNGRLTFSTLVNNVMTDVLTQNGNFIGIGTVNPQYKLDVVGDTNVTGNISISGTANVNTTMNAVNYGTYANGTVVVAGVANLNFNNTATVNVNVQSNGTQTNVAFNANVAAIAGPAYNQANLAYAQANAAYAEANSAANTVAVFANGNLVLAAANLNFNNGIFVNVNSTANGTQQTNIAFNLSYPETSQESNAGSTPTATQYEIGDVRRFGAVLDGTTDDTVAVQTALNSNVGVVHISGPCYIASNLSIPDYTTLEGPLKNIGMLEGGFQFDKTIGTLFLSNTATINIGNAGAISGFYLLNINLKGNLPFANADTANTFVAAFAGTALQANGADVKITDVWIGGFNQAFSLSGWERPKFKNVEVDCTNGVLLNKVTDIGRIEDVHCWPFLTAHQSWSTGLISRRRGSAFKTTTHFDTGMLINCFDFGWDIGFDMQCGIAPIMISCFSDGASINVGQIGMKFTGNVNLAQVIGGGCSGKSYGAYLDVPTSGINGDVHFDGTQFWGNHVHCYSNNHYLLTFTGNKFRDTNGFSGQNFGIWVDANCSSGITQVSSASFFDISNAFHVLNNLDLLTVNDVVFDDQSKDTTVGFRQLFNENCVALMTYTNYASSGTGMVTKYRYGRGNIASPIIVNNNDVLGRLQWEAQDGVNWGRAASIRGQINGAPSVNSLPGKLILATTASGSNTETDQIVLDSTGNFYPNTTNSQTLGLTSLIWSNVFAWNVNANVVITPQIATTTNVDFYTGTHNRIRLRDSGMTIGIGSAANAGYTILLEANTGASLGFYSPNQNTNGASIASLAWDAVDDTGTRLNYGLITGFISGNNNTGNANNANGSFQFKVLVANTLQPILTIGNGHIGISTLNPTTNLDIHGNLSVTGTANVNTTMNAVNYGTYANGTVVVSGVANLNFNNTATVNVNVQSNGTQTNVAFTANASALAGAYEVDIYANGTLVLANSNLNFNNTSTINLSITANGTTQTNTAFNVNTSQVAINTAPVVNPLWYTYCGV